MKQANWVQRKFVFDLPVEFFPAIIERLRGTPARLEERVTVLSSDLRTRREGDHWPIQEHVGHLGDLEPLHYKRMQEFLNGAEVLNPADMKNRKTEEADHNSSNIENLLDAFRGARMRLVELLETLDSEMIKQTSLHPRLKTPMRVLDSNYFWAEHDDHHLARITELIRRFK